MKHFIFSHALNIRTSLCFAFLTIVFTSAHSQCPTSNVIENPQEFQWTYHPVTANNPEPYFSGVMEVGEATFDINGETFTTRAYRQENQSYSIPGPTIKVVPGNKYILRFHNTLPYEPLAIKHNIFKDPNATNIHTHGLHISGESPGDDVERVFEGGRGGDYVWEIPADHMGGTYWYHAHHHGATFLQVSGGLFGMLVVDDSADGIPATVAAMEEREFVFGFLDPNADGTGGDVLMSGTLSPAWTANGKIGGNVCMPPNTWQHWRILVADRNAMMKSIEFGPECEVMLLARDGVWRTVAPKDLTTNTIGLTGASRADIAIRVTGNSWVSVEGDVVANIYAAGTPDGSVHPFDLDGVSSWSANRPDYLRDLQNETNVNFESISMGARTINGSKYDHMSPNLTLPTTQVQEWNLSGATMHPFHLHVYHVQAQATNGMFEAGEYYDVVSSNVPIRFDLNQASSSPFSGRTIMHCHILSHEDRGAMGWLNVIGGQGPPVFPADGDLPAPYTEYYVLGGGQSTSPNDPSSLTATAMSATEINLGWTDNASDETGFDVERSTDGTNFTSIASLGVDAESYSDNGLTESTTYYYRVTAFNGVGNSSPSNVANATTQPTSSGGPSVHVDDITITREALNGNRERGVATVLIVNTTGTGVAGATVNGVFSGPSSGSASGTTGLSGYATINSKGAKNPNGNWCFEVTNVTISGGSYDNAANAITQACEPNPANDNSKAGMNVGQLNLLGVHPNPFKKSTRISFKVPNKMKLSLAIYNLLGERVALIDERNYEKGDYFYDWTPHNLHSGTYILQIKTEDRLDVKRLILIR